jgi:hypothetical protein
MTRYGWMLLSLMVTFSACGGDEKSSAERAQEAQRAMQEGMQKERQMYEGMRKAVEGLEKQAEDKSK